MKPTCLIQSSLNTRSGYGQYSRDIIRQIISYDKYDVQLISMPWGACPMNALDPDNPKDKILLDRILPQPITLHKQPELFIHITVPNEFNVVGKYNIGITAGIETTMCSKEWIDGMERMDLILAMSEHSKNVLKDTVMHEAQNGQPTGRSFQLTKPIDILPGCVDTSIFKKIDAKEISPLMKETLKEIHEDFCFLFVGHWLKGNVGEDRKNVGMLVKVFCETFKNRPHKPALILKTSGATFSIMDQNEILGKIEAIRHSCGTDDIPNVYLLHGDLTQVEMNELYNHPKVKVHVSLSAGEGGALPLAEASFTNKPIIASGWSGQLDYLNPDDAILLGGELVNIPSGAVWPGVILAESKWFAVNPQQAGQSFYYIQKNYGKFLDGAYRLSKKNKEIISYEAVEKITHKLLDQYVPRFAMPVPLKLPPLRKVENVK